MQERPSNQNEDEPANPKLQGHRLINGASWSNILTPISDGRIIRGGECTPKRTSDGWLCRLSLFPVPPLIFARESVLTRVPKQEMRDKKGGPKLCFRFISSITPAWERYLS